MKIITSFFLGFFMCGFGFLWNELFGCFIGMICAFILIIMDEVHLSEIGGNGVKEQTSNFKDNIRSMEKLLERKLTSHERLIGEEFYVRGERDILVKLDNEVKE